jgi:hypothetical protein
MASGFGDLEKIGKENFDAAFKGADAFAKGVQAVASEAADYSRQAMEAGALAFEKLISAPSLDKAVEVQTDYLRSAYESYVGQATKIGEIVVAMTKETYKPYEGLFGKVGR